MTPVVEEEPVMLTVLTVHVNEPSFVACTWPGGVTFCDTTVLVVALQPFPLSVTTRLYVPAVVIFA